MHGTDKTIHDHTVARKTKCKFKAEEAIIEQVIAMQYLDVMT